MFRIILIILLVLSLFFYFGSRAKRRNTEYDAANTSPNNRTRHNIYDSIEKLADLRSKGLITEEEYKIEKKKLLNQ